MTTNTVTPATDDRTGEHPAWCLVDTCPVIEHVSPQFFVRGEMPFVVEVVQSRKETTPRVSILEDDGEWLLEMPPEQAERLAEELLRVSRAVRTGAPLEALAGTSN
jgi:hypothetical protein